MSHVQIDYGQAIACHMETAQGRIECPEEAGVFRFFVTVFEAPGQQIGMWDGDSYDEAIRVAEKLRDEWGFAAPVVDMVAGGAK